MTQHHPFWSDDFDLDLLRLFPRVEALLGAVAAQPLWTLSRETHGRINCPATWSAAGCLIWLEKPNLPRDKHGWFNWRGLVGDSPEMECTWLELLRDNWIHQQPLCFVQGERTLGVLPRPSASLFTRIMYHVRGWRNDDRHEAALDQAWRWIASQNRQVAHLIEHSRLGRDAAPYFAAGTIPGLNAPMVTRGGHVD